MEDLTLAVEWGHRLLGYVTVFLVAPVALYRFSNPRIHRGWGTAYLRLMIVLYVSGVFMTFVRGELFTRDLAQSLCFNFLGFSFVLYGVRSARLLGRKGEARPENLDWAMAFGLLALGIVLASIARTAWRPLVPLVLLLAAVEIWELVHSLRPKSVLYRRHMRYMFASYLYVLTVLSVVHLGDLLGSFKWQWTTLVGAPLVLAMSLVQRRRFAPVRMPVMRAAVRSLLVVVTSVGVYIVYDAATDETTLLARMVGG